MQVEWDEPKRLSNLEDHGVDFKDAALIFEGVFLEAEDKRGDHGEPRFRAMSAATTSWSPTHGAARLAGSSAPGE
jgi:uncharacterized DUF497 family protein